MQVDKGANFIHRAWLGGFFAQCRQLGADLSESFIEPAQFPRNVAFAHRVLCDFKRYVGDQMRPPDGDTGRHRITKEGEGH